MLEFNILIMQALFPEAFTEKERKILVELCQNLGPNEPITKTLKWRIMELTNVEIEKIMLAVKSTMEKIQTVLNPDGFNVGWNEKPAGGQVVPHLHLHIFPRFEGDGGTSMHSIIKNPGSIPVSELAEKFKK